ncbi:SLC13 family permease [Kribbella pittospori]|uniref:SLC13 family permease n=1 Tax=Kribbella pittospori TaxID=722689 RepID=UPI001EE0E7D5|nr:SLC13 family permease [Kribbella pittospori]
MVLLMIITAVASPFLDNNVTTIMLVAPVTIVVCERLRIPPQPYLIAEVFASNIGGAATLIGDPPNIIIGSRAGLSFNDFVVRMTPIVVIVFVLFVVLTRFLFRKSFRYTPEQVAAVMALQRSSTGSTGARRTSPALPRPRPCDLPCSGRDLLLSSRWTTTGRDCEEPPKGPGSTGCGSVRS